MTTNESPISCAEEVRFAKVEKLHCHDTVCLHPNLFLEDFTSHLKENVTQPIKSIYSS